MKISFDTPLSEDAIFAKEMVKAFVLKFEPYFKDKLEAEKFYALKYHNIESSDTVNFYNQIAMRGGKRIRAALANYAYKMLGGTNNIAAMELARAIEMTHAYLLVIDDYMDKSQIRRGGLTAHISAEHYFKDKSYKRVDHKHQGSSMAINAALLQMHRAQEVILELDTSDHTKILLSKNLNSKISTTAYGQITDTFNALKDGVSERDVLDMLEWKTGVYTFENPLHSGAILAGGSNDDLHKLSLYAIPVGIAFQIYDDIIGMFGDSKETGKSNKDDLAEGKMTLLIQYALSHGTNKQLEIINKYLGNPNITSEQHGLVQQVLIDCGSLEYSKQQAIKFVFKGKDTLKDHPANWSKEGIRFLRGVADYVIQRNS